MPKEGIFSHIMPNNPLKKQSQQGDTDSASTWDAPPATMSFSTFARKVLPTAKKIEYSLPVSTFLYFFLADLPGTKPLMQWHDDTNRARWYTQSTSVNVST